jgi:hypothetical protein
VAQAKRLEQLRADLHHLSRSRATSAAAVEERRNAAQLFEEELRSFYGPFRQARSGVRENDPKAVVLALLFLEADPWCFHSGYEKASLMHALANGPDLSQHRRVVQDLVLTRMVRPQAGLFRHTARLAAAVWDDDLRQRVEVLDCSEDGGLVERARRLLQLVEHQRRTDRGASTRPTS